MSNATTAQFLQLVAKFAQVLPLDADKAEMQKAIENENDPLWVAIADRFVKKTVEVVSKAVKSLREMIAAGRYDWVNGNINERNFGSETLVTGEEPKLYHFDRDISSEDVIAKMDTDGYRPASLGDLLVYGAKNPEEQRQFPIVALGSVARVGGGRGVAYLGRRDSERGLDLDWFGFRWNRYYRFLAVRK